MTRLRGNSEAKFLQESSENSLKNILKQSCHNLEQKVGDKFTKVSKTDFSMECFTADFMQCFISKYVKIWLSGGRLGTRHQAQTVQGFLKIFCFPKILSLKSFGNSCGNSYSFSGDNNLVPFHLW